jgi:hypothetical protein
MLRPTRSPGTARTGPLPPRLRSRLLVVGAALLILSIMLGCLSFGGETHEIVHSVVSEPAGPLVGNGILEQEGSVRLPPHSEQDVYYPVPYISPPNLVLGDDASRCELVSQAHDHFHVKNADYCSRGVTWKAKGIKVLITGQPTSAPASTGAWEAQPAPQQLPAEPVPVLPKS